MGEYFHHILLDSRGVGDMIYDEAFHQCRNIIFKSLFWNLSNSPEKDRSFVDIYFISEDRRGAQTYQQYMNFNIIKRKSTYDEILGRLATKQANITIFLHQLHVWYFMNKGEMSLKCNQ